MRTKPILDKVFLYLLLSIFEFLQIRKKGWQAGNPSYMMEPKIEVLAKRGMISISL
jgi:hypothetical protein